MDIITLLFVIRALAINRRYPIHLPFKRYIHLGTLTGNFPILSLGAFPPPPPLRSCSSQISASLRNSQDLGHSVPSELEGECTDEEWRKDLPSSWLVCSKDFTPLLLKMISVLQLSSPPSVEEPKDHPPAGITSVFPQSQPPFVYFPFPTSF